MSIDWLGELRALRGLISYEGVATADGAIGGGTVVCSDLTLRPDYDGNLVVITSGSYIGQARDINGATNLGTVTPHIAFDGQIVADTEFIIVAIRTTPAEIAALTALVILLTADVADVETKLDLPAVDSVLVATIAQVLGTKGDTALQAVAATASLVRYVKGLITASGDPTADTLTTFTDKWGNIARSLDLILGNRWDVGGDLGTDIAALLADVGDASGSILGSLYAILGNPEVPLANSMGHVPKFTGEQWFVSKLGNDGNTGTYPDDAFLTIVHAVSVVADGDRIKVMAGTYNEAGLDLDHDGLELICEQGTIISNATPGTVLIVSADYCRVVGAILVEAGEIGIQITGDFCSIEDCLAFVCSTGFDDSGLETHMTDCRSVQHSTTGFAIAGSYGERERIIAVGAGAVRGIYLDVNTADYNHFKNCHTLGNTTAGWDVVGGADNNVFANCTTGGGDGAKVDIGGSNTWANFAEGSLIDGGQTRDQDLKDIYDRLGGASTEGTLALPNDVAENTAFTIAAGTPNSQRMSLQLDLSNLVQNADIRIRYDMHGDGAAFPITETFNWTVGMDPIVYFREISGQRALQVTVESVIAQGAVKDIDYEYVVG